MSLDFIGLNLQTFLLALGLVYLLGVITTFFERTKKGYQVIGYGFRAIPFSISKIFGGADWLLKKIFGHTDKKNKKHKE